MAGTKVFTRMLNALGIFSAVSEPSIAPGDDVLGLRLLEKLIDN